MPTRRPSALVPTPCRRWPKMPGTKRSWTLVVVLLALFAPTMRAQAQSDDEVTARLKWERAKLSAERGDHAKAVLLYEECIAILGPYPELLHAAGQAALAGGDLERAKRHLEQ